MTRSRILGASCMMAGALVASPLSAAPVGLAEAKQNSEVCREGTIVLMRNMYMIPASPTDPNGNELSFADAKGNRRWDRLHGRGVERARTESGLMVFAQNLQRLDKLTREAENHAKTAA